jgi:hypothetical protein
MTAPTTPPSDVSEPICCPPFDPEPWEGKTVAWENKRFIKDRVFTLFHIPCNFGRVMRRLDQTVRQAGATILDQMCLADHTSRWNMDVHVAVDKEVPGAANTSLSGRFYSRVYEGPFQNTGQWCQDFAQDAQTRGLRIKKMFMWYTTCPKCARKYGKNYVAIVGQVA